MLLPRNSGFWRSILTSSGRMVGGVCCISVLLSKFPHWLVHSVCNRKSHVNHRENWDLRTHQNSILNLKGFDKTSLPYSADEVSQKPQKLRAVATVKKHSARSNLTGLNGTS